MTLPNGLFHKDLGMPRVNIKFNCPLRYSNHALRASRNDRYGKVQLPERLNTMNDDVVLIELETKNGRPHKGVYRMSHCDKFDLIVVVLYETRLVKTVWLNCKNDNHSTLKEWKYTKLN